MATATATGTATAMATAKSSTVAKGGGLDDRKERRMSLRDFDERKLRAEVYESGFADGQKELTAEQGRALYSEFVRRGVEIAELKAEIAREVLAKMEAQKSPPKASRPAHEYEVIKAKMRERIECLQLRVEELEAYVDPLVETTVTQAEHIQLLLEENKRMREALELIAAPKRADGTYNRCREACEEIARKALKGVE